MKTILPLVLVLLSFSKSQAQTITYGPVDPNAKPNLTLYDSLRFKFKPKSDTQSDIQLTIQSQVKLSNPLIKIDKNVDGFDFYKSSIDNMIVLKPDSSNAASTTIPNGIGNIDSHLKNQKPKR